MMNTDSVGLIAVVRRRLTRRQFTDIQMEIRTDLIWIIRRRERQTTAIGIARTTSIDRIIATGLTDCQY